ncbi:peptidoglycan-binding protein [Streptomyces sp. ISL-66]|uniref:peptidoglycan-binding protein n=1 Tax=Streptomyces sp. ISL-66 TaxID=2819186 RepID=UPI001BEB2A8E|nr:peptidoglycan-binding protein [Streptomyces sp. ISL-66]MBT2471844.1 peptidoglycan-binding protein [Streptomyces sp. ISL-66]
MPETTQRPGPAAAATGAASGRGSIHLIAFTLAFLTLLTGLMLGPAQTAHAADVPLLQRGLAGLSYLPMSGVDGVAGPQTADSVRHFQHDNGLEVDGQAGPLTMAALLAKVKKVQSAANTGADGDYGPATLTAVRNYQTAHHLDVDGIAGPQTMGAMNIDRIVSSGQGTSPDTRLLQRNLAGLGYLPLSGVDGAYGPITKNAVLSFQSDNDIEVDGIAGPQTNGTLAAKVKQVQSAANTGADGDYGPATLTAVRNYQTAHHLDVDGIAGPQTMAAMGITREIGTTTPGGQPSGGTPSLPPLSGSVREKTVQAAQHELDRGVHEWGNNCNPYGPCEAWCAHFASWTWQQAGIKYHTAFTGDFYYYGRDHGTLRTDVRNSNPQPGDVVLFGTGPGSTSTSTHVGVVERNNGDGTVTTIEGNYQDRVARVQRPLDGRIYAVVAPAGS